MKVIHGFEPGTLLLCGAPGNKLSKRDLCSSESSSFIKPLEGFSSSLKGLEQSVSPPLLDCLQLVSSLSLKCKKKIIEIAFLKSMGEFVGLQKKHRKI